MLEVELTRTDAKEVAGSPGDEARLVGSSRGEYFAEARNLVAQRVVGRIQTLLREELADQPLARDDAIRA